MDIRVLYSAANSKLSRLSSGEILTCDWDTFPPVLYASLVANFDNHDPDEYWRMAWDWDTSTLTAARTDRLDVPYWLGGQTFITPISPTKPYEWHGYNYTTSWQVTNMYVRTRNSRLYWILEVTLSGWASNVWNLEFAKQITSANANPRGTYTAYTRISGNSLSASLTVTSLTIS